MHEEVMVRTRVFLTFDLQVWPWTESYDMNLSRNTTSQERMDGQTDRRTNIHGTIVATQAD